MIPSFRLVIHSPLSVQFFFPWDTYGESQKSRSASATFSFTSASASAAFSSAVATFSAISSFASVTVTCECYAGGRPFQVLAQKIGQKIVSTAECKHQNDKKDWIYKQPGDIVRLPGAVIIEVDVVSDTEKYGVSGKH